VEEKQAKKDCGEKVVKMRVRTLIINVFLLNIHLVYMVCIMIKQ